jgi:serine/threonine protein phosphatase 1
MAIAVGDVHGCLVPLERLVRKLPAGEELVFLGDYIDRGPDSSGVVDFLARLAKTRSCRFLKGNHEDLMERAIEDPAHIPNWMYNGGNATLASYGVRMATWKQAPARGEFAARHRDFFASLATYHEDEHTIYVHAGVDPAIPEMERQSPEVLLWIRERFFRNADLWQGKQIIFGHTPTLLMGLADGEIFRADKLYGIDTGCVYGGCLTAIDSRTLTLYQEASDFRY